MKILLTILSLTVLIFGSLGLIILIIQGILLADIAGLYFIGFATIMYIIVSVYGFIEKEINK